MDSWEKVDAVPKSGRRRKCKRRIQAEKDIRAFLESSDDIWRKEFSEVEVRNDRNFYDTAINEMGVDMKVHKRGKYLYLEKVNHD